MVAPFLPDEEKTAAIRAALPATSAGIYLDTPTCGPLPAETAQAMAELRDWELRTGRGGEVSREETSIRHEEARGAAAAVIVADPDDVLLTHGAADGIAGAIDAVDVRPGDRIVVHRLCSPVAFELARAAATRCGARVDVVDALDDRPARIVLAPHVSPLTGAALPVAAIAAAAHAAGATVVVDGTEAAGAIPIEVDSLGVDLYVLTSETWLMGPQGIGALWVRPDLAAGTTPLPAVPGPFGTGHDLGAVVGFARSCGWLSMAVGLGWIHERTKAMASLARELLAAVPGVHVLTPADQLAGIVAFRIDGWSAPQALDELGRRVFAIASPVDEIDAIRIGAACFTTPDELVRFRDGVAELAAHTPETLPRPRRLAILGEAGT